MSKIAVRFSEHDLDWYLERLDVAFFRREEDAYCACPICGGSDPLHVQRDGYGVRVFCFSCGATRGDIDEVLTDEEPVPIARRSRKPEWRPERGPIVARYVYTDADGKPLYRKNRHEPKEFSVQTASVLPAASDGAVQHDGLTLWNWGLHVEPVPYNYPAVLAAAELYVAAGERDANALNAAGVVATCSPFGEMTWPELPTFVKPFADKRITIVADRDQTGYAAAWKLAAYLGDIATSVAVVEPIEGKDAAEHFAAGHTLDGFQEVEL